QRGVSFEIALRVIVVPAADGEYGYPNFRHLLLDAQGAPEAVEGGMGEHIAKHGDGPAGGGDVRGAQRQVQNELGKIRMIAGGALIFGHPFEAVSELEGAAGG